MLRRALMHDDERVDVCTVRQIKVSTILFAKLIGRWHVVNKTLPIFPK